MDTKAGELILHSPFSNYNSAWDKANFIKNRMDIMLDILRAPGVDKVAIAKFLFQFNV